MSTARTAGAMVRIIAIEFSFLSLLLRHEMHLAGQQHDREVEVVDHRISARFSALLARMRL